MPYLIVFLLGPLGAAIAVYRRNPRRFLDGPTEDAPLRLMRWAVSRLAPQRAEWGQAMLGELAHLGGWPRRMRFPLGCTAAALVLPPWGRAAAGVWAMIALAAANLCVYAGLAIHYRLGIVDWVQVVVLTVLCIGFLLGASALLRRPGVALPGLLGGLFATVATLSISGFTFYDQVAFIPGQWQLWAGVIIVPALVGAVGTLWRRDQNVGRRVARLAALSAGLLQLGYATLAVAVIGGGGPPDQDGGFTLRGTITDRLGNNIVQLVVATLVIATVGWAGAALAGLILRRTPTSTPVGAPGPEAQQEA
jgi:hypothetical protein